MSENVFQEIGHDAKVAVVDTIHVVKEAVEFPVMGIKVIETCVTDYPALKPILTQLVTDGESVAGTVATAVAAKGLNFTTDEGAAKAVVAFFEVFKNQLVPAIVNVYGQIVADETPAPATVTTTTTAPVTVTTPAA